MVAGWILCSRLKTDKNYSWRAQCLCFPVFCICDAWRYCNVAHDADPTPSRSLGSDTWRLTLSGWSALAKSRASLVHNECPYECPYVPSSSLSAVTMPSLVFARHSLRMLVLDVSFSCVWV